MMMNIIVKIDLNAITEKDMFDTLDITLNTKDDMLDNIEEN